MLPAAGEMKLSFDQGGVGGETSRQVRRIREVTAN